MASEGQTKFDKGQEHIILVQGKSVTKGTLLHCQLDAFHFFLSYMVNSGHFITLPEKIKLASYGTCYKFIGTRWQQKVS